MVAKTGGKKKGKGKGKKAKTTETVETVAVDPVTEESTQEAAPDKAIPNEPPKGVSPKTTKKVAKPKKKKGKKKVAVALVETEAICEVDAILCEAEAVITETLVTDTHEHPLMGADEPEPEQALAEKHLGKKRPSAADFMIDDEESDDSEPGAPETAPVVQPPKQVVPAVRPAKRPRATDMLEAQEFSSELLPKEEGTVEIAGTSADRGRVQAEQVEEKEEVQEKVEEEEDEKEEEQEEDATFQGGLEFLGYPNFDAYSNSLLPTVVQLLRVSKQLPTTKDEYDFFQSYPSFMAFSKNQGQRLLQLIAKIFKHHHVYQAWNTLPTNTVTGIDEQTEAVVEANDTLLERVDKILDMLKQDRNTDKLEVKQKSSKNALVAAWNTSQSNQKNKPIRLLHTKNILRPQLKWKIKPDNTSSPFVPLIRMKPNAKVPLPEVYQTLFREERDTLSAFLKGARGGQTTEYPHPYQHELETIGVKPWQLEMGLKQEPKEITDTPLTVIDTPSQIPGLIEKLSVVKELAVDLEAHSYRSYLGFTCLMQLSTRTEDFIVDTLALRHDLGPLNQIFTNPNILKVLHGANNDVVWLQRDLGLYLVNMFDSYHASKQLGLPRCSLSYLLHRYCQHTADKQYQLADWRIRPLPEVMIKYAREDTHFLLYVYDCLRYELLHQGAHTLESVYRNSTLECLQTFTKPISTPDSYLDVYNKIRILLKPQQKDCLRLIYNWRDETARNEDESPAFVLPNHMMMKIAELLPTGPEGILGCCNPPPPLVRLHVQELHLIVERGRHYNPLLDPLNTSRDEEEYTPGFLDTTHQYSVESMFQPKQTPARRMKERKEIFYVPKSGPDLVIKKKAEPEADCISIQSETGTISGSVSSLQFFDVSTVTTEISEAVKSVTEAMAAPFKMFMSRIEALREEEKTKAEETAAAVYPIQQTVPEEDIASPVEDNAIIFKPGNKRPSTETAELKATTKRRKKTVGDINPFNYEEVTMSKLGASEDVKPAVHGDMLNKGEDSRAKQVKQRTNSRAGNKSSFQSFLKKKFKK